MGRKKSGAVISNDLLSHISKVDDIYFFIKVKSSDKDKNNKKTTYYFRNVKILNEYGFIINLDDNGQIHNDDKYKKESIMLSLSRNEVEIEEKRGDYHCVKSSHKNNTKKRCIDVERVTLTMGKESKKKENLLRLNIKRREIQWSMMLDDWDRILTNPGKRKKLRRRVRKGIPNAVRGRVWTMLGNIHDIE